MKVEIKPWLIFVVLIGFGIIVFSLIRGCQQGRNAVVASDSLKKSNDSLTKVTTALKQEMHSTKQEYQDSLGFVNGQLALKDNQIIATKYQLDSADKRITSLLSKYKAIQPATDTSVTVTPNEFINDCNQCFAELSNGQEKVKSYMAQIDNLNQTYQSKINIQQNRISQLDKQNTQLAGTLQSCLETSKNAQRKLEPHGQLFFSWSVLWVPLPTMAGIGLMYQNKYCLQIGVRGMFGKYGNGFETEMNMPLSFKRK